jgi:uncharacterized protein
MKTTVVYDSFSVLPRNEREIKRYSIHELENLGQFQYQPTLCFETPTLREEVLKACRSNILTELSVRQKWCSAFYRRDILSGALYPDLILKWVSPIVGYGLFAGKDIPVQSYIGTYTGVMRRWRWWFKRGNDYCFEYTAGDFKTPFFIDAEKKGGLVRFINHSENPNLETMPVLVEGVMYIILCAIAPILKGTQLTYDYGEDYWRKRDDPSGI